MRKKIIIEPGADLRYARLCYQDLRRAVALRECAILGADFRGSDMRHLVLRGTDLRYSDFTDADLRYADLRECNLRGARFNRANLTLTDFRGADLTDAFFEDADISKSIGLATIKHEKTT